MTEKYSRSLGVIKMRCIKTKELLDASRILYSESKVFVFKNENQRTSSSVMVLLTCDFGMS